MSDGDAWQLNARGNLLSKEGRFEEAVRTHEVAVAKAPQEPKVWHDLAATYLAWRRFEAAEAGFRTALEVHPDAAQIHFGLGTALLRQRRFSDAVVSLQAALSRDPASVDGWCNVAAALSGLGRFDEAGDALETAYKLGPDAIDAAWNLALHRLRMGDFAEGFRLYESRRRRATYREPHDVAKGVRAWDGAADPNATVLVRAEQGFGDTVQYLRFVQAAKARVRRVVLQVRTSLLPWLMGRVPGADELVGDGQSVRCDLAAPLMSLPHLLGVGEEIGIDAPYLSASEGIREELRESLGPRQAFRVAIAWQGNPAYEADQVRSIPLAYFEPLIRLPVRTLSLQKVHGLEQLAQLPEDLRVENWGEKLDNDGGAFEESAAFLNEVDLFVTSDSALAHVAGAMMIPTYLLLPKVADYRWGVDGDKTLWYPSLTLFRQQDDGDWSELMERVVASLSQELSSQKSGGGDA